MTLRWITPEDDVIIDKIGGKLIDHKDFTSNRDWIEKSLAQPNIEMYIYEAYGFGAIGWGQITKLNVYPATIKDKNIKEEDRLAWSVQPEYRNQGHGTKIARELINLCSANIVTARIDFNNIASIRVAWKAGMGIIGVDDSKRLVMQIAWDQK